MKTTIGHAILNGGRLYYEVAGSGSAVVLIHGFSLDTRMWDAQFETFARKHTVVRYDVRGFGRSDKPGAHYSNADDLKALLDHLNVERAAACGLSMGGTIATEFTLRYPERVSAFIPVDAAGGSLIKKDDSIGHSRWAEFVVMMGVVRKTALKDGVDAARDEWLNCDLFAPERELPEVKRGLEAIVGDYSGWHWVNPGPYLPFKPDPSERYGEIRAPSLIVVGERDLPPFHSIARGMAADIPGAKLAVLPGAGHMVNMDAPELFNRTVLDFLAGVLG